MVGEIARDVGFIQISLSSTLLPMIKVGVGTMGLRKYEY